MENLTDLRVSKYFPWEARKIKLPNGDYQVGYVVTNHDRANEFSDELKILELYPVISIQRYDILKHWYENKDDFLDEYNVFNITGLVDHFAHNVAKGYCNCYVFSADESYQHCIYNADVIKSEIEWCYRDVLISLLAKENNND